MQTDRTLDAQYLANVLDGIKTQEDSWKQVIDSIKDEILKPDIIESLEPDERRSLKRFIGILQAQCRFNPLTLQALLNNYEFRGSFSRFAPQTFAKYAIESASQVDTSEIEGLTLVEL